MAFLLPWHNLRFWIRTVLSSKILSTVLKRNAITVLAGLLMKSSPFDLHTERAKSESLAPDIGGKEKEYMKGKIKYTDEPMGKVKVIADFLPSPEELALKDETVKVTIALSKTSVDFFKKEAKKNNTQYQKMIRRLLDEYTAHQ